MSGVRAAAAILIAMAVSTPANGASCAFTDNEDRYVQTGENQDKALEKRPFHVYMYVSIGDELGDRMPDDDELVSPASNFSNFNGTTCVYGSAGVACAPLVDAHLDVRAKGLLQKLSRIKGPLPTSEEEYIETQRRAHRKVWHDALVRELRQCGWSQWKDYGPVYEFWIREKEGKRSLVTFNIEEYEETVIFSKLSAPTPIQESLRRPVRDFKNSPPLQDKVGVFTPPLPMVSFGVGDGDLLTFNGTIDKSKLKSLIDDIVAGGGAVKSQEGEGVGARYLLVSGDGLQYRMDLTYPMSDDPNVNSTKYAIYLSLRGKE